MRAWLDIYGPNDELLMSSMLSDEDERFLLKILGLEGYEPGEWLVGECFLGWRE